MFIMAVEEGVRRGVPKAKTTEAWGLNKNAYSIYKKQYENDDLEPKKITGRPPEFNEEVHRAVCEINKRWRGRLTFDELSDHLKNEYDVDVSGSTIHYHFHKKGWRYRPRRHAPKLTEEHMLNRSSFAMKLYKVLGEVQLARQRGEDDTVMYIDIDEKNFKQYHKGAKQKICPEEIEEGIGGQKGRTPVPNTNNTPQLMFMSAVALPNQKRGFDGRVGIWPFAVWEHAARTSKNRPAGTPLLKGYNVTHAETIEMIKVNLWPAIQEKARGWAKKVVIQMDNATPHRRALPELEAWGRTLTPPVEFWMQPAQSPDMNLNDLCFFSSLKSAIYKPEHPDDYFRTLEEMKERIDAKYASYHSADRVEKFWAIKYQVAQTIYLENGGNQYKLPHGVMAPRNAAATRGA